MTTLAIQNIIEEVESLPNDDQQFLIDLFQKRISERRRDEIANNAHVTLAAIKQGKAKIGSLEDFLNDINED